MRSGLLTGSFKWLLAVFACAYAMPASASVVTFSGLVNFQNYSEAGMNMTSDDVWNWPGAEMAHMDNGIAVFQLASGGNFNLTSVEMINAGGSGPGRFAAYLDGNLITEVDIPGNAGVYNFGPLFQNIDELRVTVPGSHFTYDNINFTAAAVPEPATFAALGMMLVGGMGYARRLKKRAA